MFLEHSSDFCYYSCNERREQDGVENVQGDINRKVGNQESKRFEIFPSGCSVFSICICYELCSYDRLVIHCIRLSDGTAVLSVWKNFGWSSIIYIAAIVGIDSELYDAARVDGASKLQTILHITVPGILPTYVVMLLLDISRILSNGFDQYFMFYNPLVADRIEVLDYYVYKIGFIIGDYPYSITLGMLEKSKCRTRKEFC